MPFGYVAKPKNVLDNLFDDCNKENSTPNAPRTRYTVVTEQRKKLSASLEKRKRHITEMETFIENNSSIAMRTRFTNDNVELPNIPIPERLTHILSDDMISTAIRLIMKLTDEKANSSTISTKGVIERAADYLDVSETKLRELRDQYFAVRGNAMPFKSEVRSCPIRLNGKIRKEWFGPLREEISRIRLTVGKAVEIPHIIQWFRDSQNMTVTRCEVYYALKKMGFLFGKTKKLLLRRESDRITALRRKYLKTRIIHDGIIDKRKKSFVDHADGVRGPNQREFCYLYLDESYVNRNHCRGETWFHPEDQYGCACNLPSGKVERLHD